MTNNSESGFIALTSVIIISLLLITITIGSANSSYGNRFNGLAYENKIASSAAAYACLQYALARLSENEGYSGGSVVRVGPETCSVISVVSPTTDTRIILVQSNIHRSFSTFKFTIRMHDWVVLSRQELSDRGS